MRGSRLRWHGQAAAVDGFQDLVAAAGEERGAGLVAQLFGIVSVAGVAENASAVGVGNDRFEMDSARSG
jgi:hypothetical protein